MFAPADTYVPQFGARAQSRRAPAVVWAAMVIVALVPALLIVAAPLLLASGHTALALPIYEAFSYLCHQLPERSLHLEGQKLAVCSRCTGLYFGFALSVLLYPLARSLKRVDTPRLRWLLLAAVPVILDWGLTVLGLWENTHLSRFLTGALFSVVAAVYVVPGLVDLGQSLRRRFGAKAGALSVEQSDDAAVLTRAAAVEPTRTKEPVRSAPSDYGSPSSRI
ncbi:MAG TPA: DUF2085 domain-containing protein [Pyrinomonadaceae bacterium]|jgi:uncharacterized membrane protein|nr:DUF2085 domain-containing protein [Pyrinomonadaceae bacterium]